VFRAWILVAAGVVSAVTPVIIALVGHKTTSPPSRPSPGAAPTSALSSPGTRIPPSMTDSPAMPHGSVTADPARIDLRSALLRASSQTATLVQSGTDLSILSTICGGSVSGATATAYELFNDQQEGWFVGETITSWRSVIAAGQFIEADRRGPQTGRCVTHPSNGTDTFTAGRAESPPPSCQRPGLYSGAKVDTVVHSPRSKYSGYIVEAQCGDITISVSVESKEQAVTQATADGDLNQAISQLNSVMS